MASGKTMPCAALGDLSILMTLHAVLFGSHIRRSAATH